MKKSILFLAAILISISTFAQGEKYAMMMQKTITEMDEARDGEALQSVANKFERIASAEGGEWLPNYYFALCQINMALMAMQKNESDKIGAYVEKAQIALDKAKKMVPTNSELETMQGFIYMANIWENPMIKGATYGPKAGAAFDKAMELDPQNPRPYLLQGQNVFFTPAFFGGGAEKAAPLFAKAQENFDTFEPETLISPNWGAQSNAYFLEKVK